jgi:integrase
MTQEPEILPPDGRVSGSATAGQPDQVDPAHSLAIRNMGPARLALPQSLRDAARSAGQYIAAAKSKATRRAYASDWRHFAAWCDGHGLPSLPATPDTVTLYIAAMADPPEGGKPFKASTISRRLSSINTAHKAAGFDSPAKMDKVLVAETLHGIRRIHGTAPTMKKPLTLDRIVKILGTLEGPIAAARDKALLLLGFVGGLRRSELAALRVEHLTKHRSGYTIRIPRSKTDQEGKGREIEIVLGSHELTCPVLALENWMAVAPIKDGYLLRSVGQYGSVGQSLDKDSVGEIIKKLVRRARLAHPEEYGGHSLRAGFVTEASANGATDRQIMRQTGHKSRAMIDRYSREDRKDRQIAASKLGL